VLSNRFIWSQASVSNGLVAFLLLTYSTAAVALWEGMKTGSPYILQSFTKELKICISCVTGPSFQEHILSKGVFISHQVNKMAIAI